MTTETALLDWSWLPKVLDNASNRYPPQDWWPNPVNLRNYVLDRFGVDMQEPVNIYEQIQAQAEARRYVFAATRSWMRNYIGLEDDEVLSLHDYLGETHAVLVQVMASRLDPRFRDGRWKRQKARIPRHLMANLKWYSFVPGPYWDEYRETYRIRFQMPVDYSGETTRYLGRNNLRVFHLMLAMWFMEAELLHRCRTDEGAEDVKVARLIGLLTADWWNQLPVELRPPAPATL